MPIARMERLPPRGAGGRYRVENAESPPQCHSPTEIPPLP
jgi:hypothetical protein